MLATTLEEANQLVRTRVMVQGVIDILKGATDRVVDRDWFCPETEVPRAPLGYHKVGPKMCPINFCEPIHIHHGLDPDYVKGISEHKLSEHLLCDEEYLPCSCAECVQKRGEKTEATGAEKGDGGR